MMTILYEQFNEFMDYHSSKITKTYKFMVAFEGTEFFLDRKERLERAMKMFDAGIILPQKIAAAIGMRPYQMRRHMEESKAMGFMDMLTPPTLMGQKIMAEIAQKGAEKLADKGQEGAEDLADKSKENAKELAEVNAKLTPKPTVAGAKAPASKTAAKPAAPKATAKPEGEKGRPKKSESELGEEGMKTRETGANIGRGGKV